MFWHEYTDSSGSGVSAADYVRILSQSDFVLCPPGYSLVTHRPIEALLRGAVPILNEKEVDLYGLEMRHGVHCIAVKDDRWEEAVLHALDLPREKVRSMRRRIHALRDRLSYHETSKAMCRRLGLECRKAPHEPSTHQGIVRKA
ncbi:hypothetical protein [Desulfacinum hydrothermale]|uniref:hypothetical protein n=1 Tax=Desulfacinum hydrothermale TaxID=109258 RepID=UPI001FE85769|nr:hypothetical protein [Desulfacinum hydrothermale]